MNLILCDDDKVFLNKLEIRIRGLSQKHKIAVKMECYVSAKEMLEGIKNLDEISVFFIDIDMPEVNGCIFRKNCASVPEERSAIPLQTEQSSAG